MPLKTVILIMSAAVVLTGSYGIGVIALLKPTPAIPSLGQTPGQAAVAYLHLASADMGVHVSLKGCVPLVDNGLRVTVRCKYSDDQGNHAVDVYLVKSVYRVIDAQPS